MKPSESTNPGSKRLDYQDRLLPLDGLRSIAVVLVVLFHYFVRWTPPHADRNLYPYEDYFANNFVFRNGALGVQLFFCISGFVIALTLNRCSGPWEFFCRRYARLAPTMLVFSLVTFSVLSIVPNAPFPTNLAWILPSIAFVDPGILSRLTGLDGLQSMDGAYWSLYVEVKFYALAAIAFFWSRPHFHWLMSLIAVLSVAFFVGGIPALSGFSETLLISEHVPWFLVGIGFFVLRSQQSSAIRDGSVVLCISGLLLGVLIATKAVAYDAWAVTLVVVLFGSAFYSDRVATLLSVRPLVLVGAASYSLYLVHQYVGVTIISIAGRRWSSPAMGAVLVGGLIVTLSVACVLTFRYVETPISRAVLRILFGQARSSEARIERGSSA